MAMTNYTDKRNNALANELGWTQPDGSRKASNFFVAHLTG